jgi:hypothetical protein
MGRGHGKSITHGVSDRLGLVPLNDVAEGILITCPAPFDGNLVVHLPRT